MAITKKLPAGTHDKRRNYPIDALRARFWYAQVLDLSGCKGNTALAKRFGGETSKWRGYGEGKQPNELTLGNVENELPGSFDLYTSGPNQLKLWPAISSEDTETLKLIYELSNRADAMIACFKLDVLNNNIQLPDGTGYREHPDDFDLRILEILRVLEDEIGEDFAKEAKEILESWLQPFVEKAYDQQRADFMDFIMDSRANNAYTRKLLKEEKFHSIALPTVKQKGRREKDE